MKTRTTVRCALVLLAVAMTAILAPAAGATAAPRHAFQPRGTFPSGTGRPSIDALARGIPEVRGPDGITLYRALTWTARITRNGPVPEILFGKGTVRVNKARWQALGATQVIPNCTLYVSDPYWWTTHIQIAVEGDQFCTGGYQPQRIRVTLQKHLFLDFWNNVHRNGIAWSNNQFVSYTLITDCSHMGTQTWRGITDGWATGGVYSFSVQSGTDPQLKCI